MIKICLIDKQTDIMIGRHMSRWVISLLMYVFPYSHQIEGGWFLCHSFKMLNVQPKWESDHVTCGTCGPPKIELKLFHYNRQIRDQSVVFVMSLFKEACVNLQRPLSLMFCVNITWLKINIDIFVICIVENCSKESWIEYK